MEPYDLLMIGVLVTTTVLGAVKGMAWQIASLASLGVSFYLALRYSEQLAPIFGQKPPYDRFLAILVIYLVTSLVVWIGFRFVRGAIDRIKLAEFDRQLGALFGLAKGVLFCVAITFFAVTLSEAAREHVLKSRSGYYIAQLLNRADEVMPPELKEVLGPYIDRLEHELEPAAGGHGRGPVEASVNSSSDAPTNLPPVNGN